MSTTEWQMQFIAAILSRLSNGIVQFQIQTRGFLIADFTQNHTDGDKMRQSIWKDMFFCSSFFFFFFLQQEYISKMNVYMFFEVHVDLLGNAIIDTHIIYYRKEINNVTINND